MRWHLETGPRSPSKLVAARAGSPTTQPRALATTLCGFVSWFLPSPPSEAVVLALSFFFTRILVAGVPLCEQDRCEELI